MRTRCAGDSRGRSSGKHHGNAFLVSLAGSSAPITNSPAGTRTSVMPIEFRNVAGEGDTSGARAPGLEQEVQPQVRMAEIRPKRAWNWNFMGGLPSAVENALTGSGVRRYP